MTVYLSLHHLRDIVFEAKRGYCLATVGGKCDLLLSGVEALKKCYGGEVINIMK